MNFPFICSNISAAPAYGVYISQLMRNVRAYGPYHECFDKELLLTRKLRNQGFLVDKSSALMVANTIWLTVMEYLFTKAYRFVLIAIFRLCMAYSVISSYKTSVSQTKNQIIG